MAVASGNVVFPFRSREEITSKQTKSAVRVDNACRQHSAVFFAIARKEVKKQLLLEGHR